MANRWRDTYTGYALALGGTAAAILLRGALDHWLGNTSPYIVFYFPIALAAYVGGLGPGMGSALLATLFGKLLFIPERGSLRIDSAEDIALLLFFVLSSVVMILLVSWGHTARREARLQASRLQHTLAGMPDSYLLLDHQWRILDMNAEAERALEQSRNALLGRTMLEAFPDARQLLFGTEAHTAMQQRTSVRYTEFYPPLAKWLEVSAYPSEDGLAVFFRDVTRRKRAEEALLETERRYRIVAEHTYDWEFWQAPDGRFLYNSPSCLTLTGYDAATFNADPDLLRRIVHPEDRELYEEHVGSGQACATEQAEFRIIRLDGGVRWIGHACQAVYENGEFLGVRGSNRDITERKEAERALRESEERFRMVAEKAQAAFGIVQGTKFVYANPYIETLSGYTMQELLSMDIGLLVHPDSRAMVLDYARRRQLGEPVPTHYEFAMVTKGGEKRWLELSVGRVEYQGKPAIVGTAYDVTDRKRAEEGLRQARDVAERSRVEQQAIVNSMTEGLVVFDPAGKLVDMNPAALALHGVKRVEEVRRPLAELQSLFVVCDLERNVLPVEAWPISRALRGETFRGYEVRIVPTDGARREWIGSYGGAPVLDADGRMFLAIVTMRDITELMRAEEELKAAKLSAERAKAAAEQASRAKDHFLAVLSHELRTPLTPVLAAVSMLQAENGFDVDATESLSVIRRNVELEARLIDDLLDMTRIARGKVELRRRPIRLCEVISRAVEVCKPDIEGRRLHFGVDMGPAAPYVIDADPPRLQQVFWNLLKNSVKFTPPGGCVGIRCRRMDGYVVAEVNDTGEGIEPDALSRIFDAFEQAERSVTRQFGGLGLGLTISKALVEMHGGSIQAHSGGRGKGATFELRLPLVESVTAPIPSGVADIWAPTESKRQQPLNVLLVEDHGDTARIMARLLMRQGYEVRTAGDVAMALELADRQQFDVLVSDLGLPDRSGVELIRELRDRGHKMPAIALSGYGMDYDVQRSREAGFTEHLVKPVQVAQLHAAISRAAAERDT